MMFRKLTLTLLALVGSAVCVLAQEPVVPVVANEEENVVVAQTTEEEAVVEKPQQQSVAPDVVTKIHHSAQTAMDKYNAQTSPKEIYQGYRIRIFASNTQTARTDAEAAIALFEEHFKAPVYFAYENPYFIVTAGNCLTHEEAIVHLSKVKRIFPKAFIVTCEIPAEALIRKPEPRPEPTPEGTSESALESAPESTEVAENNE